ncbi:hypothetical protein F7725_022424 [Dissostichus mawsoni]|uniref:Uncharacterized protein n=1 Tax=Dissostichus mawsoni TaxID=36200 RepID=A0A7J5Z004_DISMA|nr:hypothetical protein F7725_022424 [Dissostichus mawsoni]
MSPPSSYRSPSWMSYPPSQMTCRGSGTTHHNHRTVPAISQQTKAPSAALQVLEGPSCGPQSAPPEPDWTILDLTPISTRKPGKAGLT